MPPKRKKGNNLGPKAKRKPRKIKQEKVDKVEKEDDYEEEDDLVANAKDGYMFSKPKFTCPECNKKYKYDRSYKAHLRDEHSKVWNALGCPECPARCPNQEKLDEHMEKVHKREIFNCPTCNKEFARHAHVLRHIAQTGCTGLDVQMYPCEICQAEFTRKDNLMVHLRVQHITRKNFRCKICSYSTRSFNKHVAHYLTEHMDGKMTFECDVCGNSTSSRAAMTKHLEIHGEKKYSCDVCNYSTYTVEVIRRHVLTHVDEKPYQCTLCVASFIQMAQLRKHQQRHQNTCDVCNKGFQDQKSLAIHMAHHQPVKPDGTVEVECPTAGCDQVFKTKKLLTKHLRKDHDERPFACEVCDKRYRKVADMKKHVSSHTLERPRRCMYCVNARAYVRGMALVQHVRKQHPNVFRDQLNHVRFVLGTVNTAPRVTKSELESILNVLDAEAERIIDGYGEGVLYGGMQEVEGDGSSVPLTPSSPIKVVAVKQEYVKTEDKPLMSEDELGASLSQLLSQLIDHDTLQSFGWPQESVDVVLEKVIEQCGAKPADRDKYTRWQRLRENAKHLFLYVVEDKTVSRMLQTHTIDQIVKYILDKVTEVDLDGDLGQGDLDQVQEQGDFGQGDLDQEQGGFDQGDLNQEQGGFDQGDLNQEQGDFNQGDLNQEQGDFNQGDLNQDHFDRGDLDQNQEQGGYDQGEMDQDQEQGDFHQEDFEQNQEQSDLVEADLVKNREQSDLIEVEFEQNQEQGEFDQQGDSDQDQGNFDQQGDLDHDQKQGDFDQEDLKQGNQEDEAEGDETIEVPVVEYSHILGS